MSFWFHPNIYRIEMLKVQSPTEKSSTIISTVEVCTSWTKKNSLFFKPFWYLNISCKSTMNQFSDRICFPFHVILSFTYVHLHSYKNDQILSPVDCYFIMITPCWSLNLIEKKINHKKWPSFKIPMCIGLLLAWSKKSKKAGTYFID